MTVTREMIHTFAELHDPQPMHVDDVTARDTILGESRRQRTAGAAVIMGLLVDPRLLSGTPIVRAEFRETEFHAPVRQDDTLLASAEVLSVRPSRSCPDRGFMDLLVTASTTSGVILVMQHWSLVVLTKPRG